jgi:TniQ
MTGKAATRSDEVRVLPFRVRPLPDEPFDSWLEKMAATYGATMNEMACALGLIEQEKGLAVSATAWMADKWATTLTEEQAARLEASTGIPADQFHEMTRMRFARHAIRYTRQGRISAQCPAAGTAGRYCPECLVDSGGRWRMSWQFPFGFACARHRRLLVDRCQTCDLPARHRAHPLALVPVPGRCHNPVRGPGRGPQANRCRADLTEDRTRTPVPQAVLDAQRAMMRIVSTGQAQFGIYADAPQPAVPVLEDIRLLSRTARDAIVGGHSIDASPLGRELIGLFEMSEDWTRAIRARPDSAVGAAVGTTLGHRALTNPAAIISLLQGRLAHSTSYTAHTPQLQTLIAAALGRRRRPTVFLQSAPPSGVSPEERARKVPAQLWGDWIAQYAPLRVDNEIAASALAAAVVFTGTRLTHSAALALLDPHAPSRQVTHVMRELGRSTHHVTTLHAVLRLAALLDTQDVPIDYARRRHLDYTDLLPESQWGQLCRDAGVSPDAYGVAHDQGEPARRSPLRRGAPAGGAGGARSDRRRVPRRQRHSGARHLDTRTHPSAPGSRTPDRAVVAAHPAGTSDSDRSHATRPADAGVRGGSFHLHDRRRHEGVSADSGSHSRRRGHPDSKGTTPHLRPRPPLAPRSL